MRFGIGIVSTLVAGWLWVCGSAWAGVTPGWECIPKTAGKPVLSGGTGSQPRCHKTATAVLAPTYVDLGVGGQPTAEFSSVNVQIVSGMGSTAATLNGRGDLVVGYAENAYKRQRTGSNDLIVGINSGWTGYGDLIAGANDSANADYAAALGVFNSARGRGSLAAGYGNVATGDDSSVTGGEFNLATDPFSSVSGGCQNRAGASAPPAARPTGICNDTGGVYTGIEAVLGGFQNTASGAVASVSGGDQNGASGLIASVAGGESNLASGEDASVAGGGFNTASGYNASVAGGSNSTASGYSASVAGGQANAASSGWSSIVGGDVNKASSGCQSIPAAPVGNPGLCSP